MRRPARRARSAAFGVLAALGGMVVIALAWRTPAAEASVVSAYSAVDKCRKAELIVVGVPEEAQSRRHVDGRLIVTDVSVRVEKVQKGAARPGESLLVTLLGGDLDGVALNVPGEAMLPLGKRTLLFLYSASRSGDLRVVGMAQGAMAIEANAAGTPMIIPGGSGGSLVERQADGRLHPAPAALMQPEPADALLAKIQQLVAAQAR